MTPLLDTRMALLANLLMQVQPRSKDEALALREEAWTMANYLEIAFTFRDEGEEYPTIFPYLVMYPHESQNHIGVWLDTGNRRYGWRWSIKASTCFDRSEER